MMSLTEKLAYIQGLCEGLALDETKPETKLINAMIDLIDDIALTVADLDDELAVVTEQVDLIDEDLESLEEDFYEDEELCMEDYETTDGAYSIQSLRVDNFSGSIYYTERQSPSGKGQTVRRDITNLPIRTYATLAVGLITAVIILLRLKKKGILCKKKQSTE